MNLTDEQIEAAAKAMHEESNQGTMLPYGVPWDGMNLLEQSRWKLAIHAAAPLLQMLLAEPTKKETGDFRGDLADMQNGHYKRIDAPLINFIERRNASLIPKPVDPRREKIAAAIRSDREGFIVSMDEANRQADRILAALDAKE
jgi:hypothetical protein